MGEWGGPPGPQPDLPVGLKAELRSIVLYVDHFFVYFHRRRLPHLYEPGRPVFVTWRLHGSLPENRYFPIETLSSGKAFAAFDRLLDEGRTGPVYLRQPEIAQMVVDVIRYGEEHLNHYELHAYVVMPNHVHMLMTPVVTLPKMLKSIKGFTAKRANALLGLTGSTFWQEESYDRLVRDGTEFERIRNYIEENPVRAGLVSCARDYSWSSAAGPTRRSAADEDVCPTDWFQGAE